jgi:hypothetical protein
VPLSAPALLAEHHELDHFDCGEASLDDWPKKRARTNHASGASRVNVTCEGNPRLRPLLLSSSSITTALAPGNFRQNMPDPIPVVLLGRLAVYRSRQGQKIGPPPVQGCRNERSFA